MYRIKFLILFLIPIILSGCYTQLAVKDYRADQYEKKYVEEEERQVYSDSDYYDESDTTYYSEGETVINNFYLDIPSYRRYFSFYSPNVFFNYSVRDFYDPFFWDPWNPWNTWCLSSNYYFWRPWFHHSYYPGFIFFNPHMHHRYWDYAFYSPYKDRTNDLYRLRDNVGGRNSIGNRTRGGRENPSINIDREGRLTPERDRNIIDGERQQRVGSTRERIRTEDRNRDRDRNRGNDRNTRTRRQNENTEREVNREREVKRQDVDENKKEPKREVKRQNVDENKKEPKREVPRVERRNRNEGDQNRIRNNDRPRQERQPSSPPPNRERYERPRDSSPRQTETNRGSNNNRGGNSREETRRSR